MARMDSRSTNQQQFLTKAYNGKSYYLFTKEFLLYKHLLRGERLATISVSIENKKSWIQKINLQYLPRRSLTTAAYLLFNVRYRPWPAQDKQQDIVKALGIQQDPMSFVPGSYWRILIKCNASIDWTEILVYRPQWLNLMVFTLLNLWKIHGSRKVQ